MKHLKLFEEISSSKYNVAEIEDKLRQHFDSEEDFFEWCCKADNKNDIDYVDLSIVAQYDIPILLGLEPNDDDLQTILIDLLTEIDFNEYYEPRDVDIESWKSKKSGKKYNL